MTHQATTTNYSKKRTTPCKCSGPCHCGCEPDDAAPPRADDCCDLVCFERPRYFCGHLLTDGDLSAGQRYLIEKHKLYNRALHGHGVVCGLRITCHPRCDGFIQIGEGYAIDDCGHDLVVCETRDFDVAKALRDKKLLPKKYPADPCKPKEPPPACERPKCFYLIACYREVDACFTTPFTNDACHRGPAACEATRTREWVEFDLVEELPEGALKNPHQKLSKKSCTLMSDSAFYRTLISKGHEIGQALSRKASTNDKSNFAELFKNLHDQFLLHLDRHPDLYHCSLRKEIKCIPAPSCDEPDADATQKSFQDLLNLAEAHQAASDAGDCVVESPCPPCGAGCVVLGSVEVRDENLIRVCNCPREYVPSALACHEERKPSTEPMETGVGSARTCCPLQEFDTKRLTKREDAGAKDAKDAAPAKKAAQK